MSLILQFPKQVQPRAQAGTETRDQSADILFFTGVRIERHTEDEAKLPRPHRRGTTSGKRHRKA